VIGRAVRLPSGVGFDPGGIGKGPAADMAVPKCWSSAPEACTSTSAATYRVRRGWTRGSGMDWR
jgi:hypothetical protein